MEEPTEEPGNTENRETPETPTPEDPPLENSPLPEQEKPRKRRVPRLLTVDQFLRRAGMDRATSDLVLSLYGTKIMSLADWESETGALLKKKIF